MCVRLASVARQEPRMPAIRIVLPVWRNCYKQHKQKDFDVTKGKNVTRKEIVERYS